MAIRRTRYNLEKRPTKMGAQRALMGTNLSFSERVGGDRGDLNPQPLEPQSSALPLSYGHRDCLASDHRMDGHRRCCDPSVASAAPDRPPFVYAPRRSGTLVTIGLSEHFVPRDASQAGRRDCECGLW